MTDLQTASQMGSDEEKTNDPAHLESGHDRAGAYREQVVESHFAMLSLSQVLRVFWKVSIYAALVCMSSLMDGFQFGLPGGIVANKGFIAQFGNNSSHISIWGGTLSVFQILGQQSVGFLSNRFGRRPLFYAVCVITTAGIICEILAKTWADWLGSKLIHGFSLGMVQVVATTYAAEIAPVQARGALLSVYSLFFAVGQFTAAVSLQVVNVTNPLKYKNAIYSQFVLVGIWIIITPFLPESPFYYAYKDNAEMAKKCLLKFHSGIPNYDVDHEYLVIRTEIEHDRMMKDSATWFDLFTKGTWRRTLAASLPLISQPLVGVPVFFAYTTFFFQAAGLRDPFQSTVIVDCILISFFALAFITTEKVGRRPLLIFGGGFLAVANIALGITGSVGTSSNAQNASLAIICLWVAVYASCVGPLGFTMAAELSSGPMRAYTASFANSCCAALNLIFNFTVPLMLAAPANLGVKAGYVFGAFNVVIVILFAVFVPETTGRTLVELDELFGSGIPAWKFAAKETTTERMGLKTSRNRP